MRGKLLRYLDTSLKWLGFGLLAAPFALFLINAFDEPLEPEVERMLKSEVDVPAEANGFYALAGFYAPAEVRDIHAYGVRQIAQYKQALRANPAMRQYELEKPAVDFRGDKALLCEPRSKPCLSEVGNRAAAIEALQKANRLLLDRYRSLYGYPRVVEDVPAHPSAPFPRPPMSMHKLLLTGIALDVHRGRTARALKALAADTAYWRGLLRDSRTMISKAVAASVLFHNFHLLAEIVRAVPLSAAEAALAEQMLAPLTPEERSLTQVMHWEVAAFGDFASAIRSGIAENAKEGGVKAAIAPLLKLLVKDNATRNIVYREYMAVAELASAPATEFEARRKAMAQPYGVTLRWDYVYNPLGKFVLFAAELDWARYAARLHDLDGYLRLVRLQWAMKRAGASDPEAFLGQSGAQYADPYTGQPMGWNAETKSVYFTARGARRQENAVLAVYVGE